MSSKLIGAVSLKVKPDTKNFRDEADRDLRRQMRGWDKEVDVKAKVDADTTPARRKLEDLKQKARQSLTVDVNVDDNASRRWADYADDAKKNLRRIRHEMEKLDSDAENGLAKNWAQRKGQLRKEADEYRDLLRSIVKEAGAAGRSDKAMGFDGIQNAVDKLHAQQQRLSKISANSWNDTAKAVDRYKDALARLAAHEQNDDGSLAWTDQGVKLLDAVDAMERQVAALKDQDARLMDLQRRWDSLGDAQKRAVSQVMTSENNADIERAKQDIEEFQKSLQNMSTMQVANLRKARLEAEKLSAVEAELEARRRRLRTQKAFNDNEIITTTPDSQNKKTDLFWAERHALREYARDLENLTAIELKRLERVTHDERRHAAVREEIERRRMAAKLQQSFFDESRQKSDNARVEREHRAHLGRMEKAEDSYNRTIRRSRQQAYEDMFGVDLDVNTKRDLDKLAQMYKDALKPGKGRNEWESIKVKLDDESVNKVKQHYEKLKREIDDIEADVIANPTGFLAVAAHLKYLTRPRTVNIFAKVHGRSLAIAQDTLKGLAGLNVAQNIGEQFENAFRNIDQHVMRLGKLGTVLGSVGAAAGGAAGAIASVGAGLVQSVGLLAALPTAVYAGAASFGVFRIAFADFANAFSDIPIVAEQALGDLPPLARKAVEELRGTWTSIRVPVQEAFWGQMGDSIGQLKKRIIPQIRQGLLTLAPEAAKATKGVLDSFLQIADNGQLRTMMENTGAMMRNASDGAKPLFDAINRLGLRGSEYLPRFGRWLADGAKGFDDWIKKADEAGKINQWIEDGVQSVRDFGSSVKGASKMLGGLAKAALDAGGPTLGDLARGLNNVGDSMNREPFKSRMATLFDGAFRGVGNLTEGVKALGRSVGESAGFWAELLDVTTSVAKVNMTNLARFLSNNHAQSGVLLAFEGMLDMANQLGPSFDNVAHIVGDVGRIARTSFGHLAPIINTITSGISDVVSNLTDGAIAAIPALTGQINAGLQTLVEVLRVVSAGVGAVAEGFGALPAPIQQAVTAFGAFLLMRGSLGRMMEMLGNSGPIQRFRTNFIQAGLAAGKTHEELVKVGTASMVMQTAGNNVRSFATQLKTSGNRMDALKTVGKGLFGLIGGPWGLALGVGTAALSIWAQGQAEARDRAEQLKATLDQTTGAITEATNATLNQQLATEKVGYWSRAFTGDAQTAAEAARAFGIEQKDLARIVAEGGDEYDALHGKVDKAGKIMSRMTGHSWEQTAAMKEWGDEIGVAGDKIDKGGIQRLKKFMDENRGSIDEGTAAILAFNIKTDEMAASTGMSSGAAKRLQTAFETLGSETATADQKLQAFKDTLDSFKDGQLSAQEAARNLERAWEGALSSLDGIDKTKVKFKSFFDESTGQFTRFDGEAGKIYDSAKQIMDGVLTSGQAAYQASIDAGDSAQVAADKAAKAMKLNEGKIKEFAKTTGLSVDEARTVLESFTTTDWMVTAMFGADAELFYKSWREARDKGEEFGEEEWKAILGADGADAEAAIERAKIAGVEFEESEYQAVLKGTDDQFQAAIDAAKTAGVDFSSEFYTAYLEGDAGNAIYAAQLAKNAGIDFSKTLYEAVMSGDSHLFMAAVEGAGDKGREFANDIYKAYLEANPDPAKRSAEGAKEFAEQFARGDYKAVLTAANKSAVSSIEAAAKKGKKFSKDDYEALLTSLDKTSPGTAQALRTITKMTRGDYKAAIKALNQAKGGADSAKRTLNSVPDKTADIRASNKTKDGKESVKRSLGNLAFTATVKGKYKGWLTQPVIGTLTTAVKGVWKGLFGGPGNASGSIMAGASGTPQKFDSSMPAWVPSYSPLRAYANGGIESHTAQIASPSTHSLRVWAEPETGGEAYIPLAASKRTRSVAIWKETGKRLGVYANGGIEGASAASQAPQYNFQITNNYPVAEKTSTTVNRALEFAGAPGISDF